MFRNSDVVRFSPKGLSDTEDEGDAFPGACAVLQNLVPDPSTTNLWTCRPASVLSTNFGALTSPGAVSVFKVVGSLVYGMISSGLNPGYDQPFCYNLATNTFITVSGITANNVPLTQATTGDWVPPTMDVVGTFVVVTHPGFDGVNNFFGWFNVSNPAAPTWSAGNFSAGSAIVLTTVPAWVKQFNGRGYFGINPTTGQPSVVATDPLTLHVTNAGQALTFGDNQPLTAGAGLPLSNQLGGVIQALLVFKGVANIYQITGDFSTTTLAINTLNVATGTLSPRTIATTPLGVAFVAPDGVRIIDFDAKITDPIGEGGQGVTLPFLSPLFPTRSCAACNAQVIRISVQNTNAAGTPWQEYWFDLARKVWSGPHTFPASMIDTYQGQFVLAPQAVTATLFTSKVMPDSTTGVVENGQQLTWEMQTAMFQDSGQMGACELKEMYIDTTAVGTIASVAVSILNQDFIAYGSTIIAYSVSPSLWGSAVWGVNTWGGSGGNLAKRRVAFSGPIVYDRACAQITGAAAAGFKIGDIFMRRQRLRYLLAVG